jgi:hypothetical protein
MPAFGAGPARTLERYRSLLDRVDAAAREASAPGSAGVCGSCRACCGPLSLLPIEAHALLASGLLDSCAPEGAGRNGAPEGAGRNGAPEGAACPLLDDRGCRAGGARPFACRVRGLPALHLNSSGDWTSAGCPLGSAAGDAGAPVPLAEWTAQLFRLDREFRARLASRPGRAALADLCRSPGRYRALLSPADARPLVSRATT